MPSPWPEGRGGGRESELHSRSGPGRGAQLAMASVFQRTRWVRSDGTKVPRQEARRLLARGERLEKRVGPAWYLNYIDENGRRLTTHSRATTKTEAKRLAVEY